MDDLISKTKFRNILSQIKTDKQGYIKKSVVMKLLGKEKPVYEKLFIKIGDKVSLRVSCECIELNKEYICPFADTCTFDECSNGNERIIVSIVNSIWNEGNGWFFSVQGVNVEISIHDIGKSVNLLNDKGKEKYDEIIENLYSIEDSLSLQEKDLRNYSESIHQAIGALSIVEKIKEQISSIEEYFEKHPQDRYTDRKAFTQSHAFETIRKFIEGETKNETN